MHILTNTWRGVAGLLCPQLHCRTGCSSEGEGCDSTASSASAQTVWDSSIVVRRLDHGKCMINRCFSMIQGRHKAGLGTQLQARHQYLSIRKPKEEKQRRIALWPSFAYRTDINTGRWQSVTELAMAAPSNWRNLKIRQTRRKWNSVVQLWDHQQHSDTWAQGASARAVGPWVLPSPSFRAPLCHFNICWSPKTSVLKLIITGNFQRSE